MANSLAALDDSDTFSDDQVVVTPAELLARLRTAWLNEQFAPELLDQQGELVECVVDQLHAMEQSIKQAASGNFRAAIHQLEIDRIRYILCNYLRCRLSKIEKFCIGLLQEEHDSQSESKLTADEKQFALRYADSIDEHFKQSALNRMPSNMQRLDESKMTPQSRLHQYVFLRTKRRCEAVILTDPTDHSREEVLDLEKNTQHIMPYKPISSFVEDGSADLI